MTISTEELTNLLVNHLDNDDGMDEYIITTTSCGSFAVTHKGTEETFEVEITLQDHHNHDENKVETCGKCKHE